MMRKSPVIMTMLLTSTVASLPSVQQALASFDPLSKPIPALARMARTSSVKYAGTFVSDPFEVLLNQSGRRTIKKAVFAMSILAGQNNKAEGNTCDEAYDAIQYELRDAKTLKLLKVLSVDSFEYDGRGRFGYPLYGGTTGDCKVGNIEMKFAADFQTLQLRFRYPEVSLDMFAGNGVEFLDPPPGHGAIFQRM